MTVYFCPLYSGSSGNALFVMAGNTKLLVDAGLPGTAVASALASIGADPAKLDGILITHEHADHVAGAGILSRRYHVPIYANQATWRAMERRVGDIAAGNRREFDTAQEFYIGDVAVSSYPLPHDAAQPVGYRLSAGRVSVSIVTDLGHFSASVMKKIAGSGLVLLESNHDPDMLKRNPNYSSFLKHRILSEKGHLSNEEAADALESIILGGTRHIILGHLSGENNMPELALRTACERVARMGLIPGEDIQIDVAHRNCVGDVYALEEAL